MDQGSLSSKYRGGSMHCELGVRDSGRLGSRTRSSKFRLESGAVATKAFDCSIAQRRYPARDVPIHLAGVPGGPVQW